MKFLKEFLRQAILFCIFLTTALSLGFAAYFLIPILSGNVQMISYFSAFIPSGEIVSVAVALICLSVTGIIAATIKKDTVFGAVFCIVDAILKSAFGVLLLIIFPKFLILTISVAAMLVYLLISVLLLVVNVILSKKRQQKF